ncbi:MAG: M56 family metallopeptidase, partial [bacterium]
MSMIDYIPDPFINALAWSIIHSLWQFILIALLWQVSMGLARKAPAMVKQNLSIFALALMPVAFLITFIRQYQIYSRVQRIAFVEFAEQFQQPLAGTDALFLLPKENNLINRWLEAYSPFITGLYIAGIVLFSVYFIISYTRVYNLKRNDLSPLPPGWMEVVLLAREKAGIIKTIKIRLSSRVSVPVVAGFFKPVVLFPLAVASSLTLEQVEEILLHELYHIRCKDHYINTLQHMLEILFFYHPVTWWISQVLSTQRESKVDEWVVRQTDNPVNYAQTLLSLEENRNLNTQMALAATTSQSSLFNRIKNIMTMKTRKFKSGQKIAAMLVVAVAAISLAWINPAAVLFYNAPDETNIFETDSQPLAMAQAQESVPEPPKSEPRRIVLENGNSVAWTDLSEEEKEEVKQALQEAQVAVREAMEEVRAEFESEELKKEMQKAREEVRKAMEEINNDEFKAEMHQAREEVRMALAEIDAALSDEEFENEMREVSAELQNAFKELEKIDWSEMGEEMDIIMEEVGKSMEIIGPTLQEVFRELDFEEIMKEAEKQNQKEQ